MIFPEDQIAELKLIAPSLSTANEGGYNYIRIESLRMPEGCQPAVVDALLCPTPRDGYNSRLYFAQPITGCPPLNWNGNIRVLNQNWYGISWQSAPEKRLAEMLLVHLDAFRAK